jgi:hypothetical protein
MMDGCLWSRAAGHGSLVTRYILAKGKRRRHDGRLFGDPSRRPGNFVTRYILAKGKRQGKGKGGEGKR